VSFVDFKMSGNFGLSLEEVKRRRQEHGANTLGSYRPPPWWKIFARQFQSPLVYLLVVASAIAFILGDKVDALVIWGAVLANVLVGFIQELRAEKNLASLRKLVRVQVRVIREGREVIVDSSELVPGDLVLVGAGSKVPADIHLLEAVNLEVNEAVLTGESLPVAKAADSRTQDKKDGSPKTSDQQLTTELYMGTMVTRGQGRGIVVAIGRQTRMGEVARLVVETEEEKTPLQKQLDRFSKLLAVGVLTISTFIFLAGVLVGDDPLLMFETGVALAVAAIPEGLALAVTVALVLGMRRILARRALVRNLHAIDTLGATTVICTDKTGTLTTGKMEVVEVAIPETKRKKQKGESRNQLKRVKLKSDVLSDDLIYRLFAIGALCNEASFQSRPETAHWEIVGSPTEMALLDIAARAKMPKDQLLSLYPLVSEIPFESQAQFMATLHKAPKTNDRIPIKSGGRLLLVKGSPEKVKAMLSAPVDDHIVESMTLDGLRVLALAFKKVSSQKRSIGKEDLQTMTLAGLVGLRDPLRPEAKRAIRVCKKAGLKPIMLTGDHELTAKVIARELGLSVETDNVISGSQLQSLSHEELSQRIESLEVYARVTPKDKIRIVDAWQNRDEVVAMTGDGVNDAPALKAADIGVALGSGTDVAKETADLVLLDDNFKTIVSAVEGGRTIFENIRKVTLYLLSDSFSEVILVLGSLLFGMPLPLLPAQILYINILTDGFPDIALTYESEEKEIMDEPPRGTEEPILNTEMKFLIVLTSVFTGLGSLLIFWFFHRLTGSLEYARTVTFAALGLDSLFYVYSIRTLRHPLWQKSVLDNRPLLAAVMGGFILQILGVYWGPVTRVLRTTPIDKTAWVVVLLQAFIVIAMIELTKQLFLSKEKK
jgi:Ca2+-transporting ATPase